MSQTDSSRDTTVMLIMDLAYLGLVIYFLFPRWKWRQILVSLMNRIHPKPEPETFTGEQLKILDDFRREIRNW